MTHATEQYPDTSFELPGVDGYQQERDWLVSYDAPDGGALPGYVLVRAKDPAQVAEVAMQGAVRAAGGSVPVASADVRIVMDIDDRTRACAVKAFGPGDVIARVELPEAADTAVGPVGRRYRSLERFGAAMGVAETPLTTPEIMREAEKISALMSHVPPKIKKLFKAPTWLCLAKLAGALEARDRDMFTKILYDRAFRLAFIIRPSHIASYLEAVGDAHLKASERHSQAARSRMESGSQYLDARARCLSFAQRSEELYSVSPDDEITRAQIRSLAISAHGYLRQPLDAAAWCRLNAPHVLWQTGEIDPLESVGDAGALLHDLRSISRLSPDAAVVVREMPIEERRDPNRAALNIECWNVSFEQIGDHLCGEHACRSIDYEVTPMAGDDFAAVCAARDSNLEADAEPEGDPDAWFEIGEPIVGLNTPRGPKP